MNDQSSPRMASWATVWNGLLALIVVAYGGALALLTKFIADDAYIVAHYARRFVQTGEITFNAGEHINALTSPLQFFIEVILYALTGSLVPAYRVVSVAMVLGAAWLIARRLRQPSAQVVAAISVLMTAQLIAWTMGGLDTPVVVILLAALLALVYDQPHIEPRRLYAVMVIAGLSYLARPDSVLVSVPIVLYAIYRTRNIPHTLGSAAVGAIIPVAWLIYAQLTFGDILPTSYHTKAPTFEWNTRARYFYGLSARYVVANVVSFPGLWLIGLWAGLTAMQGFGTSVAAVHSHLRRTWWIYVLAPILAFYGMLSANTHMMFGFRLLTPYLVPVLAILAADLYEHHPPTLRWPSRRATAFMAAVTVTILGLQVGHSYWLLYVDAEGVVRSYQSDRSGMDSHVVFVDQARVAANAIAEHWDSLETKPNEQMHVWTFMGGIIPYELPDAYIYEPLASWRKGCPSDLSMANYVTGANYMHYYIFHESDYPTSYVPWEYRWINYIFDTVIYQEFVEMEDDGSVVLEMGVLYRDDALPPYRLPKDMAAQCTPEDWPRPSPMPWVGR